MAKMNIPTVGSKIELIEPWTFSVYGEYRNKTLGEYLNIMVSKQNSYKTWVEFPDPVCPPGTHMRDMEKYPICKHTFPPGTKLIIDRIFIRKNMPEFDSLTFIIPKHTIGRTKNIRF